MVCRACVLGGFAILRPSYRQKLESKSSVAQHDPLTRPRPQSVS